MLINKLIQEKVAEALQTLFPDVDPSLLVPEVQPSTQPQFGHYQCNSALKLGKELKCSPREVAQKISLYLKENCPGILSNIEIAGPGFINLTLDPVFLEGCLEDLIQDRHLGIPMPAHPQKIIVEFSSPNVAKELHVGHLRSTIIGDSLARLFEFLGHHVLRLNHIGDWGTQFGMLITYMQDHVPDVLTGKKPTTLPQLMEWYRESKVRFDADTDFKKRSQLKVVALQGGDPDALIAWKIICDISRKGYQEIYDFLDIKITERGESYYNPMLSGVVADLDRKGLITISDGAKCVFLEGFVNRDGEPLPMIVQKADGGYNYDTTDMAAIRQRIDVEKADRIIYVTDAGQSLHFQMIIQTAEKAGYLNPKKVRVDHVPFGVVLGLDGKKFKTRSGKTEKLIDLLMEAVVRSKEIFKERIPDLTDTELNEMSEILGIDAIKYADLSGNRIKDYVFSYDRMLKFEGNTAAFLLYAYVRIQGIKKKVGKNIQSLISSTAIKLEHPTEIALALHLLRFGEALEQMAEDLLPNRLTDYLYDLAEKFHAFFRDCRVEGTPQEDSRLLLCEATARVLKQGLEILGLKILEKM